MKILKLYQRGVITDGERYNQVLDTWTHAREQITVEMMAELEQDTDARTTVATAATSTRSS
jgi:DNA-directed RNA polymerase subunit beta'